jgi:hypothetical protein
VQTYLRPWAVALGEALGDELGLALEKQLRNWRLNAWRNMGHLGEA